MKKTKKRDGLILMIFRQMLVLTLIEGLKYDIWQYITGEIFSIGYEPRLGTFNWDQLFLKSRLISGLSFQQLKSLSIAQAHL